MQQTTQSLQSDMQTLKQQHEQHVSSIEFRHIERYELLLRENKKLQSTHSAEVKRLNEQLLTLQQHNQQLQHDIQSGQPEERKMFEYAELQARRDESLNRLQQENRALKLRIEKLEAKVTKYRSERNFLNEQVKQHTRSTSRAHLNIDYLKSIVFRYLQFSNKPSERQALIPVIARLLQFSPQEMQMIQQAEAANSDTGSGFFSSLFSSGSSATSSPSPSRISNNFVARMSSINPNGMSQPSSAQKLSLSNPAIIPDAVNLQDLYANQPTSIGNGALNGDSSDDDSDVHTPLSRQSSITSPAKSTATTPRQPSQPRNGRHNSTTPTRSSQAQRLPPHLV